MDNYNRDYDDSSDFLDENDINERDNDIYEDDINYRRF
jgi:hypothetical protein